MTTTAIQKKPDDSIKSLLEGDSFKSQVAKVLPKHLTPDRFVRVALTTMLRVPKLANCDKASFFNALLTLSQLGLEPDGRRAHLIPFMNNKRGVMECQLIVDYKGLVELAMNSGDVSTIHADVVCENDEFATNKGEILQHSVNYKMPRGNPYAAYAIVKFKDGTEKTEIMTMEDIQGIRKRSKAKDSGPWVTDFNEMAKKTVFRRLSKWIKWSPEQKDAIEADDTQYDGEFSMPEPTPEPEPERPEPQKEISEPTDNNEEAAKSEPTNTLPVKEALLQKLQEHCEGDIDKMKVVLSDISRFPIGKPGKGQPQKYKYAQTVAEMSDNWAQKCLTKLESMTAETDCTDYNKCGLSAWLDGQCICTKDNANPVDCKIFKPDTANQTTPPEEHTERSMFE